MERGTLGESLEIEKWDLLVSVDGVPVESLDDLYRRFDSARATDQSTVLAFKRWSSGTNCVYAHVERSIFVEDLEFVGTASKEHVAIRN